MAIRDVFQRAKDFLKRFLGPFRREEGEESEESVFDPGEPAVEEPVEPSRRRDLPEEDPPRKPDWPTDDDPEEPSPLPEPPEEPSAPPPLFGPPSGEEVLPPPADFDLSDEGKPAFEIPDLGTDGPVIHDWGSLPVDEEAKQPPWHPEPAEEPASPEGPRELPGEPDEPAEAPEVPGEEAPPGELPDIPGEKPQSSDSPEIPKEQEPPRSTWEGLGKGLKGRLQRRHKRLRQQEKDRRVPPMPETLPEPETSEPEAIDLTEDFEEWVGEQKAPEPDEPQVQDVPETPEDDESPSSTWEGLDEDLKDHLRQQRKERREKAPEPSQEEFVEPEGFQIPGSSAPSEAPSPPQGDTGGFGGEGVTDLMRIAERMQEQMDRIVELLEQLTEGGGNTSKYG